MRIRPAARMGDRGIASQPTVPAGARSGHSHAAFRRLVTLGALSGVALVAAHDPALLAEASPEPGVILLATFRDGALPDGWSFDRPEVWSVANGRLHVKLPDQKQEKSFAYFGKEDWKDYQVDLDVFGVRGVDKGLAVRSHGEDGVGIDLRGPGYDDVVMYRGYSQLGKAPVANPNGKWHHVSVVVRGARYQVYVNQQLRIDYLDENNERPSGRLALAAYTGGAGECEILYDNIVVRALP